MKRILTLLAAALILTSCGHLFGQDHEHKYSKKRKSEDPYWTVKVCSLADQTGESCVSYKANKVIMDKTFTKFYDMDGEEVRYNNACWSIVISRKSNDRSDMRWSIDD